MPSSIAVGRPGRPCAPVIPHLAVSLFFVSSVYLGTSSFAATVLERLSRSRHRPALVVTRPDRPRGRGRRLAAPPVADAARELGLPLQQPDSVNSPEVVERIAALRPSAICVCAFGAMIRAPLLSLQPLVNVHPSLLPRWRGAAPIERAIEAGDEATGVSIIELVEELDAGPVCARRPEPIRPDDDFASLSDRLATLGGELLVEALDGKPECAPQPAQGVTYAHKIGPEDRRLDPERPAAELERRVRALSPHIGAHLELDGGERLGVRRAAVFAGASGAAPGELIARGERLLLACAEDQLDLLEVQPAAGRPMAAGAYLRGRGAALRGAA